MPNKRILIANWKMNLGVALSRSLASAIVGFSKNLKHTEAWVAASFTALEGTSAFTRNSPVKLGAQNAHWDPQGAFTGEISVPMLEEVGCQFAIIGHSERRRIFGESNELVAKRGIAVAKSRLCAVFCVGETLDERDKGLTNRVIEAQLKPFLSGLEDSDGKNIVFSYEPVWAIGTGKIAQVSQIEEAHSHIQDCWSARFGSPCPRILYGGSVTPENFPAIIVNPLVNGALVGGASLVAEKFKALVEVCEVLVSK